MASWCLLHLVRPAGTSTRSGLGPRTVACMGTAPKTVWQWFADCLAQGDGQPLQRLALGALARLLSTAEAEGGEHGEEVSALLCSRTFLKSFLHALGQNHKKQATEAGAVGAEQWSLGVKEILQDAGRGDTRELVGLGRFSVGRAYWWLTLHTLRHTFRPCLRGGQCPAWDALRGGCLYCGCVRSVSYLD